MTETEKALGHLLLGGLTHMDELVRAGAGPVHEVAARLLSLELKGRVARRSGGRYEWRV